MGPLSGRRRHPGGDVGCDAVWVLERTHVGQALVPEQLQILELGRRLHDGECGGSAVPARRDREGDREITDQPASARVVVREEGGLVLRRAAQGDRPGR